MDPEQEKKQSQS